tara:strand:+ start:253 stop:378 length:126 start_codon:yes stop_codon:yes gene_type:complete
MPYCKECGQEVEVDEFGISNHVVDGAIDHDSDANHVALPEE